ncbi:hybrid sensor histidine kinase/response regulator [Hymenobacter sp. GOD-10R]|uniref:hybrid sensor histidine kinase/response regulator n=1 Tax=Hymenobacter sp. GOD-10R TaxID=3093922 RepID=UPI002D7A0D46|nr:hybrid sensor histidine kinase/response regulator [Hymenobacter sp. GOD-10R]WRQ30748.1 hybrid sensor histidine kinase/response regulator [Hymenobacter sp. GOD-10R]
MKKILLVDDSEQDRMLYKRYLGKHAECGTFETFEAGSGTEALAQFKALRPDCVLLDYNLLDTDGLTLLKELGALAPADSLCVVMITGGGNERLAVSALNGGALDYLVKQQFDKELLCKTVLHAIEKNEWRQSVARHHQELEDVNRQLRASVESLTEARQHIHHQNKLLTLANQELATTNQELARTNADLDNFVYAASHDLRQPVHNLRGLFEELSRTATFNDPDASQIWRLLDDSLRALTTTITDLADVVQVARQSGEQAAEPVVMAELADHVLQTLHPQLKAAQADVQTDFSALPELTYVRSNLRTILLNLLANSLKYRHPERPARVQVCTYLVADQPVLEVKDNGLGMNMQLHGKELFQLFRRFHPQASSGTGVGLFLVNRLVQSQNGYIEVDSKVGEGTTFRVYLRAAESGKSANEKHASHQIIINQR